MSCVEKKKGVYSDSRIRWSTVLRPAVPVFGDVSMAAKPQRRRSKSPGSLPPTWLARQRLEAPQHQLYIVIPSTPAAMCGIFFSLSRHDFKSPDSNTEQLLNNRGPDSLGIHRVVVPSKSSSHDVPSSDLYATFVSTVLSLRGAALTEQPLKDDETGSILCWNGEAWSVAGELVSGSDSRAVFDALLAPAPDDVSKSAGSPTKHVIQVLSSIRGPYAFVFYDARDQFIYYGRDCLGRRSLLNKKGDVFILSSVCDNASGEDWAEVEADGIYALDLTSAPTSALPTATHIPHRRCGDESIKGTYFVGKFKAPRIPLNRSGHSVSKDEPMYRGEPAVPIHGHCFQDWHLSSQIPRASCPACP
jgi:hypothetical protein